MEFTLHEEDVAQVQFVPCAKQTLYFGLAASCQARLGPGVHRNDGAHLLLALVDLCFLLFEQ